MTRRTFRVTRGSEWLRRRLVWTVVFVLISLAGAGLATAVDRPHTQAERPELGWAADQRAEPWLSALLERLERVEEWVAELSDAGRRVLVELAGSSADDLEEALAAGDEAAVELTVALAVLLELRRDELEGAEPWRLGEVNRTRLALIDEAVAACDGLPQSWRELRDAARVGHRLVAAIETHDQLVLDALAAGREARWADAVELLEQALPVLGEAGEAARELPSPVPDAGTEATVELLDGHRAHDQALLDLYQLLAETDALDDPRVEPLRERVETNRLPLPTPPSTIQAVLSETALPRLTEQLVAMEGARGSVADALRPGDEDFR